MVDDGAAVQHGSAGCPAFFDPPLSVPEFQVAGVSIRGVGEEIGAAFLLKVAEKGRMLFHQGYAAPGLDEGAPLAFGLPDRLGVGLLRGERPKIIKRLFQVDLLPGRPQGKNLFPFLQEFFIGPALVIQFHFFIYFLAIRQAFSG